MIFVQKVCEHKSLEKINILNHRFLGCLTLKTAVVNAVTSKSLFLNLGPQLYKQPQTNSK